MATMTEYTGEGFLSKQTFQYISNGVGEWL